MGVLQEFQLPTKRQMFRQEEERSEKKVNYFRFLLGMVGIALTFFFRDQITDTKQILLQYILCVTISTYCLGIFMILRTGKYRSCVKYISTGVDVIIVSALLWGSGNISWETFKSPEFILYFVVIALAAYRFSIKTTVFAGLMSICIYSTMFLIAVSSDRIQIGSFMESLASEKVSVVEIVVKLVFMGIFSFLLLEITRGYLRVVRRVVMTEIQQHRQRLQKERLQETFSRYLAKPVVEIILHKGISLKSEKRRVTIMFCDIRDFTGMIEQMKSEEVVGFLNNYFSRMIDVVFKYNGMLDKFIGDGLMAVFGAPISKDNDDEMAVRAAVGMRDVIEAMNSEKRNRNEQEIRIGIGIHSGEVIAGNIGSEKRLEYTVIGTPVNIASRIERLNKKLGTDILVTECTYNRIKHIVEAEKNEPEQIRGVTRPITTYRIKSIIDTKVDS